MKKITLLSILLICLLVNVSFSQETRGIPGYEVKPYIFRMSDLKSFGDIYLGTIPERTFNEVEPPYAPPFPSPDSRSILNFTYDKNVKNPAPFAPVTGINFEGIAQTTSIPSEPQPAVGPTNVFVLGNVSVKITDKNGTTLSSVTQSAFFNIPVAEGPGFDSKCFYDYRRGRFVALCETQTTSPKVCKYYLAISATSNAMGTWFVYSFDMTKNGTTTTTNWSDFPGLGISDDKLVMSGQQFSFAGNLYQYQKLRIIDRALAYSGSSLTYSDIVNWAGQKFVTKPGRNMSTGNDIYIFATTWNGGTSVELRTLTGTPASPVLSAATTIPVASYGASPSSVPGGSASNTVNTGDSRTPDFFVRNGILNIAFHMGATISSTSVSAIKFLRISVNPLNTTPLTDETYGAASTYYYYPMVCLDSAGSMFMGFGRSSTTEFPSSYVTGKRRGDASIQSSVLAKAGTIVNVQSRWGDYTGIDMDESASTPGGSYAWYSGQYTKASNVFGTWVTQMNFTYGQIAGQVLDDADGDVSTTGDRTPVAGATVTLKQGASTINTKITDVSGNYNFGYLETAANYSLVFTPPSAKHSIDVIPGTGGTSQTKTDYKTVAVNLTNSQTSTGNNYIISDWLTSVANGNWNSSAVWKDNVTPSSTEKVLISTGTTVTLNADYTCNSINDKNVLQFDNIAARTLTISSNLILSNQIITLGNNNIIVNGNITGAGPAAYISTSGSGSLTRNNVGAANTLFPVGLGDYTPVTINNTGSADNFSVKVKNSFDFTPSITDLVNKQWTITEAAPGGSNATVTLQWNGADESGSFIRGSNVSVGRYNGSSWVYTLSTNASGADPYTTTASGFTQFSPFIIGNQGALPVTLSNFNSFVSGRDVKLKWITSQEINNQGFDVERAEVRSQNLEFSKLGFVSGKGNSNVSTNYEFTDSKMNTGKYQYRLKQIDFNGNFEYFDLNGNTEIGVPDKFNLSQNYPNPFNPSTKIDFDLPFDSRVNVVVYDLSGREVRTLVNEARKAGYNTVQFNASDLASGVYLYRMTAKFNGQDFVMTKKMVMIK
jgi:hypothetical protein